MFEIKADSEFIAIDGFKIAPGEADVLKTAISFAGGMREFPSLPERMPFKQFIITFGSDGSILINREEEVQDGIAFDFNSVDELIISITNALGVSIDKKKLSPSPRLVGSLDQFNSGDVIEGRS